MNPLLGQAARLYAARDYPAAESVCRTILRTDPHNFDTLHLLGVLLTLQDRPDQAVTCLRAAQAIQPDNAQMQINLGNALLAARQYQETLTVSQAEEPHALNNRGLAHRGLGQHEAAAEAFLRATQLRWDHAPAWANLATTLITLGRLEQALQAGTTALRVAPPDTKVERLADVTNEIGRTLLALGRPEEALAACRDFLQRHPDQPAVLWNMSLCLLLLGQFEEGWQAYEHRFDVPGHDRRPDGAEVLDPTQVTGKRVLILPEQGRGDMLQCIRYAPLLAQQGATVLIQAYPDLIALLAAMDGVTTVVDSGDSPPAADLMTSVMSLPLAFKFHPVNVPYLRVPANRDTTSLGPRTKPRIGIVWSGSPHSRERSAMPAETLAPLLALPGFEFHCLQKEITESDRIWLESARPPVNLHVRQLADFADTAALAVQMNVIVTIDTAIAHLGGGLALPMHVMLPFNPDWRWLLGREDSPWYPTARLFRQPRSGAWSDVVQAVIAELTVA